jgi:hypothetical protein
MHRLCHRCHAELPASPAGAASSYDEEVAMFCPRCGAPQLLLPDYMRTETAAAPQGATTGAVPPPRPQMVDWPVAMQCAAPVALLTGVLAVGGLVFQAASFFNTLFILSGTSMVLGLYRSRRPLARVDARVGVRVGLLTGVFMVGAMGLSLAATGVVERFGVHGMAAFDAEVANQFVMLEAKTAEQAKAQTANPAEAQALQQKISDYLKAPEVRAGLGLFMLAVEAVFLLALTVILGAFSGLLQTRRRSLRGRG